MLLRQACTIEAHCLLPKRQWGLRRVGQNTAYKKPLHHLHNCANVSIKIFRPYSRNGHKNSYDREKYYNKKPTPWYISWRGNPFFGFRKDCRQVFMTGMNSFFCVCPKKYVWEFFLGRNEVIIVFSGIFKGTFGLLIYKGLKLWLKEYLIPYHNFNRFSRSS